MKKYCVTVARRVGIQIAAGNVDGLHQLRRRERRAAAEHHVLGGVGQAGNPLLVRTGSIVEHRRHHRCERVVHDDDAQAVGQGRARDVRPAAAHRRAAPRTTGRAAATNDAVNPPSCMRAAIPRRATPEPSRGKQQRARARLRFEHRAQARHARHASSVGSSATMRSAAPSPRGRYRRRAPDRPAAGRQLPTARFRRDRRGLAGAGPARRFRSRRSIASGSPARSFLRVVGIDEDAERVCGAASDASAQLMELRQPVTLRVEHDHRRRVGDVNADFDDRRRDQHVELATYEARP